MKDFQEFRVKLTPFWRSYLDAVDRTYRQYEAATADRGDTVRIAVYTRVSTEEQAEEGFSLREQERICRAYAEQQGWQVYQVYADDGYSGTRDNRPAFQRLLRDGQEGKFQGVVIYALDRAYRNMHSMLVTFSQWQSQRIFLASVKENIDFTTTWGKLILVVLSMLAEIFVTNLREETKKGLRGKFAEGIHNGWLPWGYCRGRCSTCTDPNGPGYCPRVGLPDLAGDRELVPHPVDSQAFRYAHQLYCTARYSDRDIADALNRYQVETDDGTWVQVRSRGRPGEQPGPFTKEFCRDMLRNPVYTGVVVYKGSEFDGKRVIKYRHPRSINPAARHPALITEAEFERAQQIRKARAQAPQGRGQDGAGQRQASRVYVLSGRLDCATCGAPMRSQCGSDNQRRHVCSSRIERSGSCTQRSVNADVLEAELAEQMNRLRLSPVQVESVIGYLLAAGGLAALAAQREALQKHFDSIKESYARGELSREVYTREWRSMKRGLAALKLDERSDVDLNKARSLLADFGALWGQLTPLERKQVVAVLLQGATVDAGHVIAWHWYPGCETLFSAGAD